MRTIQYSLLYFLIVAPVGIIGRLVHDPLNRKWLAGAETYWIPATAVKRPAGNRR